MFFHFFMQFIMHSVLLLYNNNFCSFYFFFADFLKLDGVVASNLTCLAFVDRVTGMRFKSQTKPPQGYLWVLPETHFLKSSPPRWVLPAVVSPQPWTAGDTHHGGDDITNRLVTNQFVEEFKQNHRKDISKENHGN